VSRELYDAAYQLAENRGLISPSDTEDVAERRKAWLAEVEGMRQRLARIAQIEAEQARRAARTAAGE